MLVIIIFGRNYYSGISGATMKRTRPASIDLAAILRKCRKFEVLLQNAIRNSQRQFEELREGLWALRTTDYDHSDDDSYSCSTTSDEDSEDDQCSRSTCSTEDDSDEVLDAIDGTGEVTTTDFMRATPDKIKTEDTEPDSESEITDIWSFPEQDAEAIKTLKQSGIVLEESIDSSTTL